MRQNLLLLVFSLSLFGLTNCSKKHHSDVLYKKHYINEIKAARESVIMHISQNFVTGASIAVAKNGEVIYSEGIGLASKDLDVSANRQTKFRIGDNSSLFTNLIYLKMLEDGTLIADSSVRYYYPEFPKKENKITLRHLANDMSGIRQANNHSELKNLNFSLEQGLKMFKDDPLKSPPGIYQSPSAFNYNLLGVVMEKATGKKFNELLAVYITDTLHLSNTVSDNPYVTVKGRSDFFDANYIAQVVNTTFYDLRTYAPSKGLLSNAEDLVKLANAALYSDYFSRATRDSMFVPLKQYNGMPARMANGWIVAQDMSGRTIYGRDGNVPGGTSSILIYPEEKLVIAYACNVSSSINNTPVFAVAGAFLKQKDKE